MEQRVYKRRQEYEFGREQRVYVNGEPISGMNVKEHNSGAVSIQTKKKYPVLSACVHAMTFAVFSVGSYHLSDIIWDKIHPVASAEQSGIESRVEFPCEYLRENRIGKDVYKCTVSEGQTSGDIAEIFNDYDLHMMSNMHAPISKENVVNAKAVPMKTLIAGQPVYVVAEKW